MITTEITKFTRVTTHIFHMLILLKIYMNLITHSNTNLTTIKDIQAITLEKQTNIGRQIKENTL